MAEVMSMGEIEEFQNKHKVDLDSCNEDSIVIKSGFGNVIVVDNLLVVAADKYDKLVRVIKKIFGITEENCLWNMGIQLKTNWQRLAFLEIKPYTPWENSAIMVNDVKARDRFCSSYGTYLATLNGQCVDVWGGAATFGHLSSCAHPQVELIDFSHGHIGFVLNIFDLKKGKVMRGFEGSADEFAVGGVSRFSWPFLRWGGGKDDTYFARIGKNVISVYETQNFTLIDKKSLRVENVLDFSWSPADPIIALFVPELDGGNQPAKVSLVQIPGKEELRQKNLYGVIDCKMYWQGNGEYLDVNYTKTRKSTCASFEIFRIKERDIPIEVLELENKNDKIIAFAWEPKGHRFSVAHGDSSTVDVSFYSMRTATNTGRVSKLTTLIDFALHWSPSGRFIVIAGLNGQLEFYDVDELEKMATAEHVMVTNIEWDPTGRYVATFVTSVHEIENGFNIWSLTGKLLYKISKDHFHQFSWRPRPPSLLTAGKEEEISKNLDIYSKKYETEDRMQNREMMQQEWDSWIKKWKLLHGEASDDEAAEYEAELVEVEEVLDVKEEADVPWEFDQE
ncbi:hypothetical protein MKW92_016179 [Papaver armeniacum]|nr:hypothetical protein MKW92_016179 [Papaver armeniacum]